MTLEGRTVAITRSREDAAEFIGLAEREGAVPLPLPTIELVGRGPGIVGEFLDAAARHDPDHTVFMSSKAVRLLFGAARGCGRLGELRMAVANTGVMSVGPKTTEALAAEGVRANHQPPETFSSVGVGEEFTRIRAAGTRALIPRSGASTPFLRELLEKIGMEVFELHLYDVCAFRDTSQWNGFREAFAHGAVDGIVFTSASSVRAFFEIMSADHPADRLAGMLGGIQTVSIGPFTSDELRRFGVGGPVAPVHTVAGAFEAVRSALAGGGQGGHPD